MTPLPLPAPPAARVRSCLPGLAVVAAVLAAGLLSSRLVACVSPLLWAMGIGILLAPAAQSRPATAPGIRAAATHLLRVGVALLGLRIGLGELADVGPTGVALAVGVVAVTMAATTWLARHMGVDGALGLLIATGSAICGASAIAAMESASGAREEDVGYAVATVTIFGTAAMLLVPLAGPPLGLSHLDTGLWAGASIHEVAQVTGAGAVVSTGALKAATLVKLCRVVLLAPAVAVVGARRSARADRGMPVPGFVVAFLALVGVRSTVALPPAVLDAGATAATVLLAAGLAGLGLGVRPRALRAAGLRPLALGAAAAAISSATALALVVGLGGMR